MTKEEFNNIIDRYLSGEASPDEKRLVDHFFKSQRSKQPFRDTSISEEMWAAIEKRVHTRARPKNPARMIMAILSIVVLFSVCLALFYHNKNTPAESVPWVTKEAAYGQKSVVALTDGSKVFLNSGSSISYPIKFLPEVREIVLEGEAFFEVEKDAARPFVVRTGEITTKVLGTSFNIQAFRGKQISVTVASGKVEVAAESDSALPGGKVKRVVLNPMQQAVFKDEELTTTDVDLTKFLAWKNNTLRFDDASIADVATELERWYNVDIEFENDKILNCRINGQFKDQSLVSVLKSIQYMYNINYRNSTQNQIILYGKGCKK